jgi:protein gp37
MAENSSIEWTDTTWNPSTGCDKVSPGCGMARPGTDDESAGQTGGCYALSMAKRLKAMGSEKYQNDGDPRTSGPGFGVTAHPDVLTAPLGWRKPRKVFVNSMSDLFHEAIPDAFIARVFAVMAATPQHTYQVLTKRHGRMRSLLSAKWFPELVTTWAWRDGVRPSTPLVELPSPNVWLGVSVEDQKWADIRIPALLGTPAAVRFLSCEPLLGPVDLTSWMPAGYAKWSCSGCHRLYAGPHQDVCPGCDREGYWTGSHTGNGRPNGQPIGWVIAGGESGPGARPMDPAWARQLRDQCQAAGVPFHFKQWGAFAPSGVIGLGQPYPGSVFVGDPVNKDGFRTEMTRVGKGKAGRVLDGRTWDEFPQPVGVS